MNVVELRQYTLHPGQRDVLIELFDREFVETQEQEGMRIIGQFRDEDDPDRFVWLRAFSDMDTRRDALTAFYFHGAAWKTHGPTANTTMIDASDVLLLRPGSGFDPDALNRPPVTATALPDSRVVVTICHPNDGDLAEFTDFCQQSVLPVLAETGAPPIAWFVTEPAENTFPALSVRSDDRVLIWFTLFPTATDRDEHNDLLAQNVAWQEKVLPELGQRCAAVHQLRLAPTARSALR